MGLASFLQKVGHALFGPDLEFEDDYRLAWEAARRRYELECELAAAEQAHSNQVDSELRAFGAWLDGQPGLDQQARARVRQTVAAAMQARRAVHRPQFRQPVPGVDYEINFW